MENYNSNSSSQMSYDATNICKGFDDLVSQFSRKQTNGVSLEGCIEDYKTTRSYAETVIKMFSGDKNIKTLDGSQDLSKLYDVFDMAKVQFVKVFNREKAKQMQKAIDKKLYINLLEKFCDKYSNVLKDMTARCENSERIYENLRQAHDNTEIKSRRYSKHCKEFIKFRQDALKRSTQKTDERERLLEKDPFDSSIDELTTDILAIESKARSAAAYAKMCVGKAEVSELLRQSYEKDTRIAGQLNESCHYVSDTLYRHILQFRALIEMHSSIGDADDFDSFTKSVNELAKKTSQLSKAYHERLPNERELRSQVSPFDDETKRANTFLRGQDFASLDDIDSRLEKIGKQHAKSKTL